MTIEVRRFTERDREGVLALYEQIFHREARERFERRFSWQFERNPATAQRPSELWVGDKGGKIVGFCGAFPARLKIGANELCVLCPCDLMVSPFAAVGQNLGERLTRAYAEAAGPFAFSLAQSAHAARLYWRLGWRPVALGTPFLRPQRVRPIAERLLRAPANRVANRLSRLGAGRLAELAGASLKRAGGALDLGLRLAHRVHRPGSHPDVQVEPLSEFGAELDRLWHTLAPHFTNVFVRDAAFLRWRFAEDPVFGHSVFLARDRAGVPLGFVATSVVAKRGATYGKLMDLFCRPDDRRTIDALLRRALDEFERARVDFVSGKGLHPRIRRRVRRFVYAGPRAPEEHAMLAWTGDPELAPQIYDPESWHTSHADGDEDFAP